jgi:hypothetical protein
MRQPPVRDCQIGLLIPVSKPPSDATIPWDRTSRRDRASGGGRRHELCDACGSLRADSPARRSDFPARSRGQRTRLEGRSPPQTGKCHRLWALGRTAHGLRRPWTEGRFPYCLVSRVSRLPGPPSYLLDRMRMRCVAFRQHISGKIESCSSGHCAIIFDPKDQGVGP